MDPDRFPLNIVDVLPIRDTKAIPARLANLLTKSQHFVEFKSEESYGVPLNDPVPIPGVALGLIGEIGGNPDFSSPYNLQVGMGPSLGEAIPKRFEAVTPPPTPSPLKRQGAFRKRRP